MLGSFGFKLEFTTTEYSETYTSQKGYSLVSSVVVKYIPKGYIM